MDPARLTTPLDQVPLEWQESYPSVLQNCHQLITAFQLKNDIFDVKNVIYYLHPERDCHPNKAQELVRLANKLPYIATSSDRLIDAMINKSKDEEYQQLAVCLQTSLVREIQGTTDEFIFGSTVFNAFRLGSLVKSLEKMISVISHTTNASSILNQELRSVSVYLDRIQKQLQSFNVKCSEIRHHHDFSKATKIKLLKKILEKEEQIATQLKTCHEKLTKLMDEIKETGKLFKEQSNDTWGEAVRCGVSLATTTMVCIILRESANPIILGIAATIGSGAVATFAHYAWTSKGMSEINNLLPSLDQVASTGRKIENVEFKNTNQIQNLNHKISMLGEP